MPSNHVQNNFTLKCTEPPVSHHCSPKVNYTLFLITFISLSSFAVRKLLIRFHLNPIHPVITEQMQVATMAVNMFKEPLPEKLTISVLKFPAD